MGEKENSRLTRIWIAIPSEYLKRFDDVIHGYYSSRSEAIRHGMAFVVRDIKGCSKDKR